MKSRTIRCLKLLLTTLNVICILFGLLLMAICVMNISNGKPGAGQREILSRGILSLLLTLGLAVVVSAVFGCVGALKEHIKTLYMHSIFFIFLVVVEVVLGIGGAVLTTGTGSGSELRVHFYKNASVEDKFNYEFWDRVQSENRCCGVDGPQDYEIMHHVIPSSCCPRAHPLRVGGARRHLHASCIAERSYYVTGCEEVLRRNNTFKRNIFILAGTIFFVIQNLCIVLSGWMIRTVRTERRRLQQNLQAHFES